MVTAIIQARMGSSRFPGKMLEKINGKFIIQLVLEQVSKSKVKEIILATTISSLDDELALQVVNLGYKVFRGNENDVLDRYYQSAILNKAKTIMRITGDCPLIDPMIINLAIDNYKECDYCSNIHPPSYPDGMDIEIFSFETLENAWQNAKKKSEREHVTPYIWENPKLFKLKNFGNHVDKSGIRITIDTKEDLLAIKEIIKHIGDKKINLKNILEVIDNNPKILDINNMFERNEGYKKSLNEDEI